jgi:hypothetical protein
MASDGDVKHVVQEGEWLGSIAREYGDRDPDKIWNYGPNSKLKQHRDPNILFPGDVLTIPPIEQKSISRPTDKLHRFVVKRRYEKFEVTLKDPYGKPYSGMKYRLKIGNQEYDGSTDGEGTIRVEKLIVRSDEAARLELVEIDLVYDIVLGGMNPIKEHQGDVTPHYDDGFSGAMMRLRNLGFLGDHVPHPESVALHDDETYTQSIRCYQQFKMQRPRDEVHGKLDPSTRSQLTDHARS